MPNSSFEKPIPIMLWCHEYINNKGSFNHEKLVSVGPKLYLLFTNDLTAHLPFGKQVAYADDVQFFGLRLS